MAINYRKCPRCGSLNTVKLSDGLPAAEAGQTKGDVGCSIGSESEYCCQNCQCEWDRQTVIDNAYAEIQGIRASVGGYFGGFYDVEIDFQTRELKWRHSGGDDDENDYNRTFSQASLNTFIEGLKKADVLNWEADYIKPNVCDGTQWSLEIQTTAENIWKYGNNKFPDQWDQFCRSIRHISGQEFR